MFNPRSQRVRGETGGRTGSMSVRYNRPVSGRPGLKKATTRKKPQVRQAWDSSIQDLSVHRATPEELAHRHEAHKSKNQHLAQWELQKKSLKKKWRKESGGAADPLEERRLALMMEVLSDHYQMKDVLERSDRAVAVVKDLFGDAPRRHAAFPNITMAPSCDLETSRGPIVQKRDPPTRLSVLSESVMDSQALNEVDESRSEESDDDVDVSISFQPGLKTDRVYHILNEATSHPEPPHQSAAADNPFVTPQSSGHPARGHLALNATTAVRKVKTRLTEEEQEEPKCVIGRILNPNPPNHQQGAAKGKSRRSPRAPPSNGAQSLSELSGCGQSGLDVLNLMMREVDEELEDYERQTGRRRRGAPGAAPKAQGLTGFTTSLVSAIRRLVSYMKEGDRQLQEEIRQRRHLQEELEEQKTLIDALTAEILSMKDNCSASPLSQTSLSRPSHSPEAEQSRSSVTSLSAQALSSGLQDAEEEKDSPAAPRGNLVEQSAGVNSLLGFQPAILLSPPRQRCRVEYKERYSLQNAALRSSTGTVTERPETTSIPETRSIAADSSAGERRSGSPQDQGSKGQNSPAIDSSRSSRPSPRDLQHAKNPTDQQRVTSATPCNDITARMAELTFQNNVIKAQLRQLDCNTAQSSGLVKPADGGTAMQTGEENKQGVWPGESPMTPVTLEQRIAELNRQSAQARNKLLSLIEQQKQSAAAVSPAISPITPQNEDSGRRGRIEAAIPMPCFTDSSIEVTPSPGSSSGGRSSASRRSGSSLSSVYKEGRGTGDGAWAKVGRQKEEGWFALTTHVS